jgi:hypothetical protein
MFSLCFSLQMRHVILALRLNLCFIFWRHVLWRLGSIWFPKSIFVCLCWDFVFFVCVFEHLWLSIFKGMCVSVSLKVYDCPSICEIFSLKICICHIVSICLFMKFCLSGYVFEGMCGWKHIMVAKKCCHKYYFLKLCNFQLPPSQY